MYFLKDIDLKKTTHRIVFNNYDINVHSNKWSRCNTNVLINALIVRMDLQLQNVIYSCLEYFVENMCSIRSEYDLVTHQIFLIFIEI